MTDAIFAVGGTPIADPYVPVVLTCLAIGVGMVLAWFCLCSWTFRRLRTRHAAVYESIGSPSLFGNNTPRANILFAKFLFGFDWRASGDRALVSVCWSMVVFSTVYFCLFAVALWIFFFTTFWRK
jgi:hypothetical protein